MDEARADLGSPTSSRLFVNSAGKPFNVNGLGNLVRQYLVQAGTCTGGSCHVFRHAMATAMLDHGADIRFVREMLGHKRLETTLIYTHVSIEKLKKVHCDTHPAERSWREDNDSIDELQPVSAADVTALRERLSYARKIFGLLVNAPERTILALESGEKAADRPLLRVLQILRLDPSLADKLRSQLDH